MLAPISRIGPDVPHWDLFGNGGFSFISAWELVYRSRPYDEVFFPLFGSDIFLLQFLFFFLWHSFLATNDTLCSKGFSVVSWYFCG